MRKADLVTAISEKTGVQKVDVLVTLEAFFKEVKGSLAEGENVYIRGFGSFIKKYRAKKIGRHIKRNEAIEIPAHFIPAFKPAKTFVDHEKLREPQYAKCMKAYHAQIKAIQMKHKMPNVDLLNRDLLINTFGL